MTELLMNRAARRAQKATAKRPRGAAASCFYPEIPAIDAGHDFYPLKAFAVSLDLLPALGPRLFLDRTQAATGTINTLEGPADTDPFTIRLPFAKLREFLAAEEDARRAAPVVLDEPDAPPGFTFGLLDIVTYPFWCNLIYPAKADYADDADLADTIWKVNANLLNRFYPSLRRGMGVLTIPHSDEQPIDDAPFHNLVLWPRQADAAAIRAGLGPLLQTGVPTHYVCRERPIMDDRYALHQRRPEDGEPFNLLPLLEVASG